MFEKYIQKKHARVWAFLEREFQGNSSFLHNMNFLKYKTWEDPPGIYWLSKYFPWLLIKQFKKLYSHRIKTWNH